MTGIGGNFTYYGCNDSNRTGPHGGPERGNEHCSNGFDDDNDGFTDMMDTECRGSGGDNDCINCDGALQDDDDDPGNGSPGDPCGYVSSYYTRTTYANGCTRFHNDQNEVVFTCCDGSGGAVPSGPGSGDIDGDGLPDGEDGDIDGDGLPNELDDDTDGDGTPNGDDNDVDGDGIPNGEDNDIDGDGIPNGQDGDMDGDGISNSADSDSNGNGVNDDYDDDDRDGLKNKYDPNSSDPDFDNDGVSDGNDADPNNSYDSDGDGTPDPVDPNPNDPNDNGGDLDGNGVPNNQDSDIDGDGIDNENDKTPYGEGGSGGGNPGSGSGGIPGGGSGSGSGGGSGTGGNDPSNNDPPPDDPDQPDDISDLCEDMPSCDCIPRTFIFKGAVDYEGDCCLHYYKNLSNQMWCDCQAGDCDALASSGNDLINAAEIARQNYKAMGKNLTYAQLQNALNDHYYNLSRDQASRSNHLNQQQQARADYLNQQQAARTDFLNDQQTTRADWLNQQQHDRTAALDANQEARHKDLKQTLQGLGNDGSDDLKDALIDPGATYSDTSTDNLQAHDFATFLDARATQFSDRFDQFFESVKTSDLFTLPFGLFDSLPAGGSSAMNITIGKWGGDLDNTVGFDFADYAAVFDVLRTLFLILSAYASFKILTVKHA